MILYQKVVIQAIFFLSMLLLSSPSIAITDELSDNNNNSRTTRKQGLTPQRQSPDSSHPVKALLNLNNLDQLTGQGQVIGVIEFGGIKDVPPCLEGRILNTLEGPDDKNPHSSFVSQVVVSLAPDAKILLLAPKAKTEDIPLGNLSDAIKWAVRKGVQAINLSIKERICFQELLGSGLEISKGEATDNLIEGIQHALDQGIPVFTCAGNEQEALQEDTYLRSIWKAVKHSKNPHLFFVVGGFDYSDNVSSREDITFSKDSGRAIQEGTARRFFVTGPNKVKAYAPEDREKLRVKGDACELLGICIREFKEKLPKPELKKENLTQKILDSLDSLEKCFQSKKVDKKSSCMIAQDLLDATQNTPLASEMLKFLGTVLDLKAALLTGNLEKVDPEVRSKLRSHSNDKLKKKKSRKAKVRTINKENPQIANGIFEADPQSQKPKEIVFEETMVEGTSFATPAVATVYLKLHQYADQINSAEQGVPLLTPEDIATAMRATAYKKLAFKDDEKPEWYGCGVIDGEAAFTLCKEIIKARQAVRAELFDESIQLWEPIFAKLLGQDLPTVGYYFEILEKYKASQGLQEAPEKESLLKNFRQKMFSKLPTVF